MLLEYLHRACILSLFDTLAIDIYLLKAKDLPNGLLYYEILWSNIEKLLQKLDAAMLEAILQSNYDSYLALFEALLRDGSNKQIVALYYNGALNDNFGNLHKKIPKSKHYIGVVFKNYHKEKREYFDDAQVLYDNGLFISYYDFIYLLLTQDCTEVVSPKTRTIYCDHIIHDIVRYDTSFVSYSKQTKQEHKRAKIAKRFFEKTKPYFYAAPSKRLYEANKQSSIAFKIGYPKLDLFIKYYNKHKQEAQLIVFAASALVNVQDPSHHPLDRYKEEIFTRLLDSFANYSILFRPHPVDHNTKIVRYIQDRLGSARRFGLDLSSSYLENFAKCKYFIVDNFTSTAFTYPLATLKPVIFFSYHEEYLNNTAKQAAGIVDREKVGWVCTTLDEVIAKIRYLEANPSQYASKSQSIKRFRESIIYNISRSETVLLQKIEEIVARRAIYAIIDRYKPIFIQAAKRRISDFFAALKGKKITIYPAGSHFEKFSSAVYDLNQLDIVAFSDDNKALYGSKKAQKPIIPPDDIKSCSEYILISSDLYEDAISKSLVQRGFDRQKIIKIYQTLSRDIALLGAGFRHKEQNPWKRLFDSLLACKQEALDEILEGEFRSYDALLNYCEDLGCRS